jgi:8-oxo-dGTP diphosphatase
MKANNTPDKNAILVTQKIIVINNEGKILALRRSATDPAKPLSWDLPGGLVDAGENIVEGILREVSEEAGIKVERPKLLDVFDYTSEQGTYLICIGYVARAITSDVILSYEHDQYEWITKEELLKRDMKMHIKELVKKFEWVG